LLLWIIVRTTSRIAGRSYVFRLYTIASTLSFSFFSDFAWRDENYSNLRNRGGLSHLNDSLVLSIALSGVLTRLGLRLGQLLRLQNVAQSLQWITA
jgi:hypothetical protein